MARRTVVVDRETPLLLPPSIQEWVAADDMARFIVDAVEAVDEHACSYNWSGSGSAQYPPRMMLALLIHCYAHGVFSSRKIERATWRDVAVRFITGDHHPDHDTIAKFRRENGALFKNCFVRVLELAREMKVKRVGDVAVDGSKVEANASKRRAMTWARLNEQAIALEAKVTELTAQAEQADQQDAAHADGGRMPENLAQATRRRDEMRKAMAALEAKSRQAAAQRDKDRSDHDDEGPGEKPRRLDDTPGAKGTLNLTDADARLLPQKKGGYAPSYNVQLAVQADSAAPLILAGSVCDASNDRRQLLPMVESSIALHPDTRRILADSGYDNSAQIHQLESRHGVIVYCPPEERKQGKQADHHSAARKRTMGFRAGMRACLRSAFGRSSQRLRATTVEPVFGWIKHTLGFTRFHLRGMAKVNLEWDLVCLGYNMQLLHRRAG